MSDGLYLCMSIMEDFNMKYDVDVSVIVPVYNEEIYLEKCVQSIISQTHKNIEIILVDDGSTNSASKICDELAAIDDRIVVIHKNNEGLSSARITGVEKSKGNWIMFMDDDDIISPYIVDIMLSAVGNDIDIIAGQRIDMDNPEAHTWENDEKIVYKILEGKAAVELIPQDQQKTIITPMWGKLYRRDFVFEQNLYQYQKMCPTIYFEDVLMTPIIYSRANKICFINKKMYIHREVVTSISRSGKLSSFYYEQIESGVILLEYSKGNELLKYYAYELGIYYRTILRIWCLLGTVEIEEKLKKKYKEQIKLYYKQYWTDYMKYSTDKMMIKFIYGCFRLNKELWGSLMKKIYFHK